MSFSCSFDFKLFNFSFFVYKKLGGEIVFKPVREESVESRVVENGKRNYRLVSLDVDVFEEQFHLVFLA